jgi:peptide deformylase
MTKNEEIKLSELNVYPVVKYDTKGKLTLRKVSEPVTVFDQELKKLVDLMANTCYFYDAVGISAIQVGVPKRVCVVRFSKEEYTVFVNPEVIEVSDEFEEDVEGCLSFPTVSLNIKRSGRVKIKFFTVNGDGQEAEFVGIHARCLLHELDHLNGKLFIDHVSNLKKDLAIKKMVKLEKSKRMYYDEYKIKDLESKLIKEVK